MADVPVSEVGKDLYFFRGQRWGQIWVTGRSAYGHVRAQGYHFERKLETTCSHHRARIVEFLSFFFVFFLKKVFKEGAVCLFAGWLLIVPATCECISGTDLHRQFYVLPH